MCAEEEPGENSISRLKNSLSVPQTPLAQAGKLWNAQSIQEHQCQWERLPAVCQTVKSNCCPVTELHLLLLLVFIFFFTL